MTAEMTSDCNCSYVAIPNWQQQDQNNSGTVSYLPYVWIDSDQGNTRTT